MKLKKPKYGNNIFDFVDEEDDDDFIELDVIEYGDMKSYCRPGTSDSFVLREVASGEYNKLKITSDDVVVDFGLNIGMFTTFALKRGAKCVYSYEAETENWELAKLNVELNGVADRATLFNRAVVGNDDEERSFAINNEKNKGGHSLITKRGRSHVSVKCANANRILEEYKPSIVKMDIEGGEYEVLKSIKSYDTIQQLIFEFHHAHLNDIPHHVKYNEILELLHDNFPNVEAREETNGAWVNIVYCWR